MVRKQYTLVVLCLMMLLMSGIGMVTAAVNNAITFTADCSGFTSRGGSLTTDRDNTTRSRESIVISAVDGSGSLIYENTSIYPLNQTISFNDGAHVNWTTAPRYNPIVVRVVSVAGNGLSEQTLYLVTGNCSGLPAYNNNGFIFSDYLSLLSMFQNLLTGRSTGADPNVAPPRPTNPAGVAESQSGYAIVNTDNLFLRTGAGPQYESVGILDGGTRLVVLGSNGQLSNQADLWWYVEVGGLRGWVKSEFLILRGDLRGLPIIADEGTLAQPTLYVGVNGPLYSSRAIGTGVLCEIAGERIYNVIAVDAAEPTWYLIEATCNGETLNGWIPAERGLLRNPAGVPIDRIP